MGEYHKIGFVAGQKSPDLKGSPRSGSRSGRKTGDGLGDGYPLLRVKRRPASGWSPVDCGVDARYRVKRFDRCVGAKNKGDFIAKDGLEYIAVSAATSPVIFNQFDVGRAV